MSLAPVGGSSASHELTEAAILAQFRKLHDAKAVYAKARQLAEQAKNSPKEEKAIDDAFNARIVKPAADDIAHAYKTGGAVAAATSLHNALKGAPPEVAESIFKAAKPTVDAVSKELGKVTASNSKDTLPAAAGSYLTELRQRKRDGIAQSYPPNLWAISSQAEYQSVYGDLSASVELASRGPNAAAAAKQVADGIVGAMPTKPTLHAFLPTPLDPHPDDLMTDAVTHAVSQGDGAALSLALAKRAGETPKPAAKSSKQTADDPSGMFGPPAKLQSNKLFEAIAAGVKTLQTRNDKALKDFTTPTPEMAQLVMRWGGLAGDGPAGLEKVQAALAKTIDKTPSMKKPLEKKAATVDETAGDVTEILLDLRAAGPSIEHVDGFGKLSGVATSLQKDKETAASISVSATAQSAITDAQVRLVAEQDPSFKAHTAAPNLLWASRIARGLGAELAGMKISAQPGAKLDAALANISRMSASDRKQLFGESDMGKLEKLLRGKDLTGQAAEIEKAEQAMVDNGLKPIKARGGFSPVTGQGKVMTGLGSALYAVGAWDLLKTPIVKGQNPVPAILNRTFGAYILWGAANNGYLHASSWAQQLLVGENSKLFTNKMPVGGWLDRLTRPAVGKGTVFDYSGEFFEGGASLLLAGIAGYEFTHKQYVLGGAYLTASVAGAYPLAVKYGPKVADWAAGGTNAAAGTDGAASAEALAGGDLLAESLEGGAAAGGLSEWAGPLSAGVVLATTVGIYGYKLYERVKQSNKMEPLNRTFLNELGYSRAQAKALANDDSHGNSVGPTLQAVAKRLGISPARMGQYLMSFKDTSKLSELVVAAQGVKTDSKGRVHLTLLDHGDAIPDAPAGASPQALKAFYKKHSDLLDESPYIVQNKAYLPQGGTSAGAGDPPADADDSYYRALAAQSERPHSIDGLIQFAKDSGYAFPTASASNDTPPAKPASPSQPARPKAPAKPKAPTDRVVTVHKGDTMSGIARDDDATLPELAPLNPAFDWALLGIDAPVQGSRSPNLLVPGDLIHVPVKP